MLRVVDAAAATDVGRVRRGNEDSHLLQVPLFVVADGMGGAQAGEVASQMAVEAFRSPLDESVSPELRLERVVVAANDAIYEGSTSNEELQGMGTTLTALLFTDDQITIAHVGDSRAYRWRDGQLEQLTRDHSLVGEMVRRGAITEAEAEVHPQRSILTRALGPERGVPVDKLTHGARAGDVYLLCSDGLTGMVDDLTLAEQMGSGAPMQEIAENLIRRANENGGIDNITVVAFRLDDGPGDVPVADAPAEPAAVDAGDQTVVTDAVTPAAAATGEKAAQPPTQPSGDGPQTIAGGRVPSTDERHQKFRQSRARSRKRVGGVIVAVVLLLGIAGAVVGSLNVYFVGGNNQGLVTVYRGLPYDLPLSVSLYTRDYVTSTPVSELPPDLRERILDHKLRTRSDALDLAQQIDARKINPESVDGRPPQNPGTAR